MKFVKGDRVKVVQGNSRHYKTLGTVLETYPDNVSHLVKLDSGNESSFFNHELDAYDEKREGLIELAETLDKARLQANAINVYTIESQLGVYGDIVRSLTDTLEVIFEDRDDPNLFANLAYNSLLDGNTVREALKAVGK